MLGLEGQSNPCLRGHHPPGLWMPLSALLGTSFLMSETLIQIQTMVITFRVLGELKFRSIQINIPFLTPFIHLANKGCLSLKSDI